ncbi:MAG TPA: methyl-accepting chemotaxis protein [Polyangia bacterium]|jgi:methyl-accepting chemotaxis protein|nr:methyl-accepting chemotaxis protein [Polyangia bacterium]
MKRWTLGQQIGIGLLLPILVLAGLGLFSYWSTQHLLQMNNGVGQSHDALAAVNQVVLTLTEVETGQRGYIITGKEEYLEPRREALERLETHLERLRKLIEDHPGQQRRLEELRGSIQSRMAELVKVLELRQREGLESAARRLSEGRGKRDMDRIYGVAREMARAEEERLQERVQDADAAARRVTSVLLFGSLFAVLVVFSAGLFIVRGLDLQIGTVVHHLQSSAAELQASATQQVRGAKGQAATTTEVSTTMHELVSTSRQIAESAQRVTVLANETTAVAQTGDVTVQAAQEAMEVVRRQIDRVVLHMLDLGKRSQEIGGILDIINELAEQTNILAINATIEAAGAGDSGRRFAVVADEIRKLADRVGGSTKDIRSLIEEIRAAANTTVMATEDGSKAVEASARKFGEVAQNFRNIAGYVANTAQASREIELSTKQQTTAVEQVSTAVGEVAQTARETEGSSTRTTQAAGQLVELSNQLLRLIRREARV